MQAKTLRLCVEILECAEARLLDEHGNFIKNHEGYFPKGRKANPVGDYLNLDIDLATGRILNWGTPCNTTD